MIKAKMVKNNKYNTIKSESTNNETPLATVIDYYFDMFSFRQKPISEAFIERLAQDLVKWMKTDRDAFKISQFLYKNGINKADYYRWVKKYDVLRFAHEYVLNALGDKREIGAIKRKYDVGMVKTTMILYDSDWEKVIPAENKNTTTTISIEMVKYPEIESVVDRSSAVLNEASVKAE